ncbi:MAG: hypothetical protein M3Z09_16625 [Acidobacteriota bacterium]|nr:hypothetical protein [Acidobacteriota bacterium]
MPVETLSSAVKPEDFAHRSRSQLVPINDQFSYLCSPPMAHEDVRRYLQEPISALPPAVCAHLRTVAVMLVPFLEKLEDKSPVRVSFHPVPLVHQTQSFRLVQKDVATLIFAVQDEEVSEFHYSFYHEIAQLMARDWSKEAAESFVNLVAEEMVAKVNGEVDERSWKMKQPLQGKPVAKESKAFREYAKQAFVDTLTLYLHGICCDIDVETGPRQMPSRSVRRRLEALHALYPPPAGHAVFPEELNKMRKPRIST